MGEIIMRRLKCDIRWGLFVWTLLLVFSAVHCMSLEQSKSNITSSSSPPPPLTPSTPQMHCTNVRHALQNERGFGDIPREPISGETNTFYNYLFTAILPSCRSIICLFSPVLIRN